MNRGAKASDQRYQWRRDRPWELATFVVPHADKWLDAPNPVAEAANHNTTISGRRELSRRIFEHLVGRDISYALELTGKDAQSQPIRTVHDVLCRGGQGTCLELALAYCGLCEGADLIPCLLLLEGHALAAVWVGHQFREWNHRGRRDWNALFKGPVPPKAIDPVREAIEGGSLLPVECTGFVRALTLSAEHPEGIGRNPAGYFTFEQAREAGRKRVDWAAVDPSRRFLGVIDLAVYRKDKQYHALEIGLPPPRTGPIPIARRREAGFWPSLVDRKPQVEGLRNAIKSLQERARPLVCLVVGDDQDDHPALVRRLADHEFAPPRGPGAGSKFVPFPETIQVPGDEFDAAYLGHLNEQLPQECRTTEELAKFLRVDPRRWVLASQIVVAPGDARARSRVAALVRFWEGVGKHLADAPAARAPLAWLQIVPEAPAPAWHRGLLRRPVDPKEQLVKALGNLAGARCLTPLGLVNWGDFSEWEQGLPRDHFPAGAIASLREVLFPTVATTLPMRSVIKRIEETIE